MTVIMLIMVSGEQHIPTCHQELYAALLRHLLCRVADDEVKHVCSAVRRSQIGDPQGAVFCPWVSQVLHPILVGWIWGDAGAVEDVSEMDRQTYDFSLCYECFV